MKIRAITGYTRRRQKWNKFRNYILMPLFAIVAVVALSNGPTGATPLPVTHVSGVLSADATWSAGNVYIVDSTVSVPTGITLTIDHGAIVKYASIFSGNIQVTGGTLAVTGTSGDPVTFTSAADDTVGGDSTANGSTSGNLGDYTSAISQSSGTVNISYAVFTYGNSGITGSGNSLTVSDSAFEHITSQAVTYQNGDISLERNTFSLQDGTGSNALEMVNVPDLSGIILSGANKNSFTATRVAGTALSVNGTVPTATTWDIAANSGVMLEPNDLKVAGTVNLPTGVTYSIYLGTGVTVQNGGTVNVPAGAIFKVQKFPLAWNPAGVNVKTGGVLNVSGTSMDPVMFTSSADDSTGGDTATDGVTTGALSDYQSAITNSGGTVNVNHGLFKYGNMEISGSGNASITDSSFSHINQQAISHTGAILLERNSFNLEDGTASDAVELVNTPNLSNVILSGINKNTFTGTRLNGTALKATAGIVPSGSTWDIAASSGVMLEPDDINIAGTLNLPTGVTYSVRLGTGMTVGSGGVLNMPAGATLKVQKFSLLWNPTGIQVNSGGTFNATGASSDPVTITSSADDSIGGDSSSDGSTTGTDGDYSGAVLDSGGIVNMDHAVVKYAAHTLSISDGQATVSNSSLEGSAVSVAGSATWSHVNMSGVTIGNADTGLVVAGNSTVIFRGVFNNISGRNIQACNWQEACGVDAAYVDWGSANGPLSSTASSNLVCGSVSVAPWIHGSTTYDQPTPNLYEVRNCDNSSNTPDTALSAAVSGFQAAVSNRQIDCSGGYQPACDAIDTAYICLGGAMSIAQSTAPWPLPDSSDAAKVNAFGGLVRDGAATYMTSQEIVSPSGLGLTYFNDLIGIAGTFVTIANAYSACAP